MASISFFHASFFFVGSDFGMVRERAGGRKRYVHQQQQRQQQDVQGERLGGITESFSGRGCLSVYTT